MTKSLAVFVFLCASLTAQTIQTIAGGGPNNLPALQLGIDQPGGIAVDSSGNVYVSAFNQNQIWKIDTSGIVNRFAGTGSSASSGNGGSALLAGISGPVGLAFDSAGNLYVAEGGHLLTNALGINRIRRISTSGIITTFAGNGFPGHTGDGGPATSASLFNPHWIAFDSHNNLFISTFDTVRMVTPAGVISTVAGVAPPGSAPFGDGGPATAAHIFSAGIAVDSADAVYIADTGSNRVRKFVPGGNIATVAGNDVNGYTGDGGPATSAALENLANVKIDPSGNLYIIGATTIRRVASGVSTITTYAGTGVAGFSGDGGSALAANFSSLGAMAFNSAGAASYVADGLLRVRKIEAGLVTTFAGNGTEGFSGNGGSATAAVLSTPATLSAVAPGNLFFSDSGTYGIRSLSSGILGMAVGTGFSGFTPDGGSATAAVMGQGSAFARSASGDFFFIENSGNNNYIRRTSGGLLATIGDVSGTVGFGGDGGPAMAAFFNRPTALALAANGDLYIADAGNHRLRVIAAKTGIVTTVAGTGVSGLSGDGGLAINAMLGLPQALALDGAGNLFYSDALNNVVRKIVLSSNLISTVAGDGSSTFADNVPATATGLIYPFSLFADESSNLFIADRFHGRVRRVDATTGIITTVAGNGVLDYSGDGGPALNASMTPVSITIDRSQNLYIGDASGRIRQTTVSACFFTLSSPTVAVGRLGGSYTVNITSTNSTCPYNVSSNLPFVTIVSGTSGIGSGTVTFTVAADSSTNRTATVNIGGASFDVQQAGAIGANNVGYFNPGSPLWVLDSNGSGAYEAADKVFPFAGQAGAIAVTGDWNGDGRTKVGYYLNGFWVLDYNGNGVYDGVAGGDKFYGFGGAGSSYVPVVGDWNGDGRTKVGFYTSGFWALDKNGNGQWDGPGVDSFFAFGGRGAAEVPILGDWNGNGRTKIGFYYQGVWAIDYDGDGVFGAPDKYYAAFPYVAGDKPVVGDWNGDGKAKIGVYRGGFWILDWNNNGSYDAGFDKFYGFGGNAGEVPLVADWNGSGTGKIGVFVNGFWILDFNGNGAYDGTGVGGDRFIAYGGSGVQPVVGRW